VYENKCNTEYDVMLQMQDEVKHECVKLFQQVMLDFKMNVPAPAAPIQKQDIRSVGLIDTIYTIEQLCTNTYVVLYFFYNIIKSS